MSGKMGSQQSLFTSNITETGALSALVKSIRLRKPEDALVWLHVLWNSGKRPRMRAQRRILIGAAEDNLSIPVMEAVSDWFNSQRRFDLDAASLEVMRIINTPNWYALPRGREYIRRGYRVECLPNPFKGLPENALLQALGDSVRGGYVAPALQSFWALHDLKDRVREALVDLLFHLALEKGSSDAFSLTQLYGTNWQSLWNDLNYSGMALDVLLAGPLQQETELINANTNLVIPAAQIIENLSPTLTIPGWALDGIHCGGNDPRFSGLWKHMARACDAYEFFGRLDPEDDWSLLPGTVSGTGTEGK